MAGTHNFQVFDPANANMTADANYGTDPARLNGATNGIADPLSFNKAVHQATIMVTALAQYIANQGNSFDDTNLANIITALAKAIVSGSGVSFADRIAHGLFSTADIGSLSFCPAQTVPPAATYAVGAAGNLLGGYHYREVLISGYANADGTYFVRGFSPAAQRSSYDVSPSSQQVNITNLPLGSAGCIGRAIYRSVANGSAGSEKFCGIIMDNTTRIYTDNLIDAQLGSGMPTVLGTAIPANIPTSNTTGTTVPIPTALQVGALPYNPFTAAEPDNTTDGFHYYSNHTEIPGNTSGDGEFLQISYDASYIIQVAFAFHVSGAIATRVKDSGTWSSWSKPIVDYASSSIALTTPALRNEYFLNQSTPPSTPGPAGNVVNLYTD